MRSGDERKIWGEDSMTPDDLDQGERPESWVAEHQELVDKPRQGCCFSIGYGVIRNTRRQVLRVRLGRGHDEAVLPQETK